MRFFALIASTVFLVSTPALAQVTVQDYSIALTTAVTNCVPPSAGFKSLSLQAPDTNAADVLFCYRTAQSTPCTPSNWQIQKGQTFFWPLGSVPINGLDCTMTTGSGSVSVGWGK